MARRKVILAVAAVILAVVVAVPAYTLGRGSAPAIPIPTTDSAEAGFARDMQMHHDQGVEMALIIRDLTDDPGVRLLAYDIATLQGNQSGQMYGWLSVWGLPAYSAAEPMAWMSHDMEDMHADMNHDAMMPGMATPEQLDALEASSGVEAEVMFLELMISHHLGAVDMAEGVLPLTDNGLVTSFANSVLTSQQSEIELMRGMLEERQ